MDHFFRSLVWLTVNCSYSHSSLAVPMIHAACAHLQEWQWRKVEITSEEDSVHAASQILDSGCDLLCAALYLFNREKVFDILKRVHVLSPKTIIAVGGPECLGDPQELLKKYDFINTVFRGEGEGVFPVYLTGIRSGIIPSVVPESGCGIYDSWQDSPAPCEDPFFRTDRPFVQVETSRGCPMSCAYCTSSGIKLRFRSMDQVRRELSLLQQKGVREIRLLDRTFNYPQDRGAALLRMFHDEFPELKFHLEVHPQFLGNELRQCLQNAAPGQLHIEAGIQSLDQDVQAAIGRRSMPEDALDGLRFLCSCSGFETHCDLLAGLPVQTLRSLKQDILSLINAGPAEIQLEVLKILPGTPIRSQAKLFEMIYAPDPPYDVMKTGTMTVSEILEARKLSRLLDLFYNHEALHPVIRRMNCFLDFADYIIRSGFEFDHPVDLKKRFLIAAQFFQSHSIPAAESCLAVQWIRYGYPAEECPGKMAERIPAVPDNYILHSGPEHCADDRETKFYLIPQENIIFGFNRKYRMNKPCAEWYVKDR